MAESTFTERAEEFYAKLMREHYEVGAGLKADLEIAPIYDSYADLFSEPSVKQRIGSMRRDRASKEARHLADFSVSSYIENATKGLTEAITNAELKSTVEWDAQQVPYQNVHSILVREPDYKRRHELEHRRLAVTVKQNPERSRRIVAQDDLARGLGFASYRSLVEELRDWDLTQFSKGLDPLMAETEDIFEDQLVKNLGNAHVPRGQVDTSDIAYVMRAPEYDPLFPGDRLVPLFEKTVTQMAMPLESTPGLFLDTDKRPLKSPRAFCAPVRVPKEVYLVIKPVGGQDDYRALFHEAGHAEHFTHIDPGLPFAFRYLGEEAVSETFAFLFEHLTLNPRWLVDYLRVPLRDAEKYRRFGLFNKLWLVRRYAAKLRYELLLHDQGPEGMDAAYRDILGEILHVSIPPERYLDDVDDAFYVAAYLRAWIFERQLESFLEEHFGEGWYESRDAGGFLRSLWAIGMRDSVAELARTRVGAQGLDIQPLVAELADF